MQPPAEGLVSRLFLAPALRTQPDRRLVALVREGYETAFEEIVRRYGKPLSRYAASIVGGRAEDVTQDAFSKALVAMRRDDAEIELRPWLFRIVRNAALNELRDRPPSPEVLAETIAGGASPEEELERREELADLMRRLEALPDPQRAAIVMRELEGLSHEEIAAALGMTGGAARQTIHRARRALRDGLGMLVPLPLLQSMLAVAATPGATESAAGMAGVGGAAGAGLGAGVALKATAATVLVAGAVGAGVALKPQDRNGDAEAAAVPTASAPGDSSASSTPGDDEGGEGTGDAGSEQRGRDGNDHGREAGREHGGHGPHRDAEDRLGGAERSDDRGGERSGASLRHGGSGDDDRSGSSSDDRSGPGDGGSGSGSGSSGSGSDSSGSGSDDAAAIEGSSGSGDSGSGSSLDGYSGDLDGTSGLSG